MRTVTVVTLLVGSLFLAALSYDVNRKPAAKAYGYYTIKALPDKIGPEGIVLGGLVYLQLIIAHRRR